MEWSSSNNNYHISYIDNDSFSPPALNPNQREKGLINRAGENNCFLNVVLQSLWHLRAFALFSGDTADTAMIAQLERIAPLTSALQTLYTFFKFSDEPFLPPHEVRNVLARSFREKEKFQINQMEDAAEALEALLQILHQECNALYLEKEKNKFSSNSQHSLNGNSSNSGITSSSNRNGANVINLLSIANDQFSSASSSSLSFSREHEHHLLHQQPKESVCSKCLLHKYFTLSYVEEFYCEDCDFQISEMIEANASTCRVYATPLIETIEEIIKARKLDGYQGRDRLLKIIEETNLKETRKCKKCQHDVSIHRHITQYPSVLTISLAWADLRSSPHEIKTVLQAIDPYIEVQSEIKKQYTFRGMICFYGMHYIAYIPSSQMHENKNCEWNIFDDRLVRPVGSWSDVIELCVSGALQPVMFIYEEIEPSFEKRVPSSSPPLPRNNQAQVDIASLLREPEKKQQFAPKNLNMGREVKKEERSFADHVIQNQTMFDSRRGNTFASNDQDKRTILVEAIADDLENFSDHNESYQSRKNNTFPSGPKEDINSQKKNKLHPIPLMHSQNNKEEEFAMVTEKELEYLIWLKKSASVSENYQPKNIHIDFGIVLHQDHGCFYIQDILESGEIFSPVSFELATELSSKVNAPTESSLSKSKTIANWSLLLESQIICVEGKIFIGRGCESHFYQNCFKPLMSIRVKSSKEKKFQWDCICGRIHDIDAAKLNRLAEAKKPTVSCNKCNKTYTVKWSR